MASAKRRSAATASVALYGFVAWIGTHIAFVLFVLWAYLPERVLHRLGVQDAAAAAEAPPLEARNRSCVGCTPSQAGWGCDGVTD